MDTLLSANYTYDHRYPLKYSLASLASQLHVLLLPNRKKFLIISVNGYWCFRIEGMKLFEQQLNSTT